MSAEKGKDKRGEDELKEGYPLLIPLVPTAKSKEDDDKRKEEANNKNTNEEKGKTTNKQAENTNENEESQTVVNEQLETINENEKEIEENKKKLSMNGVEKTRRVGTTVPPLLNLPSRHRKISFADDVEQRISFAVEEEPLEEHHSVSQSVIPEVEVDDQGNPVPPNDHRPTGLRDEERDRIPFLSKRESRFSTTSRFSISSRPSFAGLTSMASMASLKSTLTKVNSELYPERGSFFAHSLGQSFAELPEPIAQKLYIVTQVLAAISVSIGSMAVGFNAAYTSTALASMDSANSTLSLTEDQKSWVGSLLPLSALTGSIIGGYLVDALGRKMLILICGPPFFSAMIIIGSAVNVWMLYVGRVIAGLCVGLLTLSLPVYLGETIQPEIRGTLGFLPTTIGNTGILVCFLVGSYVNWSWLAYIGAVVPLLFFCMMVFVPETPRWYVSKGQDENAERSLRWLRGSDNEVEFELEAIQKNFDLSVQETSSIKDLFRKEYMKALGLSIGLMLVQQLSGINAVIFYTVDIFEMSGSLIDGNLSTIIVGVVNFLSCFVANILIDKLGRKILIYISSVGIIVSLFALGAYFYVKQIADDPSEINKFDATMASISWLPLFSLMIYVIAFSLGWGPIPWLFMGEALPAKIRGQAASLVTAFNWGSSFIVTKTFPGMVKEMGPFGAFFMFGAVMVLGFLFAIFFVPETKGKTLEEIEAEISGRSKSERLRRISEISGIVIK